MKQPLVSICIPNYNNADYIEDAIQSALNQTYENIEVIIVDNCSTDNSWKTINLFQREIRVRAFQNKENLGMVGNFRKALELSSGKLVTFLCSDDCLSPNAIEQNVKSLIQNPTAAFVFGNIEYAGTRKGQTDYAFESSFKKKEWTNSSLSHGKNFAFLTGTVFRRSALDQKSKPVIQDLVFFDWYLWLSLGIEQVVFNKNIVGNHRYHSSNQTRVFTPDIIQNTTHLIKVVDMFETNFGFTSKCAKAREQLTYRTSKNLLQSNGLSSALSYSFSNSSKRIKSGIKILLVFVYKKLRVLVPRRSSTANQE